MLGYGLLRLGLGKSLVILRSAAASNEIGGLESGSLIISHIYLAFEYLGFAGDLGISLPYTC